jgi:hypothetical protein
MAHGMAGGGSRRGDFGNPEFVQEWSCFIFYVLDMDPQVSGIQVKQVFFIYTYKTNLSFHSLHLESNHKLVYNEISTAGFESLICDYKQETEGKTGMPLCGGRPNPLRADRKWK